MLFVSWFCCLQVPRDATESDVRALFEPFGTIVDFQMPRRKTVAGDFFHSSSAHTASQKCLSSFVVDTTSGQFATSSLFQADCGPLLNT